MVKVHLEITLEREFRGITALEKGIRHIVGGGQELDLISEWLND